MDLSSELSLRVFRILNHTRLEGPGIRLAIWLSGCSICCEGCCNPEMQAFDSGEAQPIKTLIKLVNDSDVEGITILGGEPLDQAPALFTFLNMIRDCGKSVILFSGYTMDEIRKSPEKIKCISCVDVLIDGPYIRAQLSNKRQFVGSENQKIWFLTERYGLADFSGDNLCEVKLSTSHFELNGFPVEFLEKWDEV